MYSNYTNSITIFEAQGRLILKYNRTINVIKRNPRVYNKNILSKVCSLDLFKYFESSYCIFTN